MKSAIIVGAGLSGLSAAALLAKRGVDVTVIEAGDRPGGSCSAFRRGDVTYDTGAAMLFGFGEKGFNPHRWLMEELGEPIDVYRHEALYRLNYDGAGVTFWPDIGRFIGELAALFPQSKGDLARFYAALGRIYDEVISRVTVFEAPNDMPLSVMRERFSGAPGAQLKAISLLFRNTESFVKPYLRDFETRRFFDKLTSTYCYTTLRETPAMLAATMFADNHVGGSYYPAGSAMALAARLEKAVEKQGGRIRYSTRFASLVGGSVGGRRRVAGVRTAEGEVLKADAILFSAAIKALAEAQDPDGAVPAGWRRRVFALVDSFPSFVVYGTVARSVLPEGLMPVEMFIDNREAVDEGDVTLYLPSLEDPGLADPDTAVFELIGPTFKAWPRPGETGYGTESYGADKRAEADRMLSLVERRIPGFMKAMRSRIEGSPSTIERYLGKPRGSVAGPKQKMGQHLLKRQGSKGFAPGLYFAGEATVMGTGTPAVTVSGISAANRILRTFGMPDFGQGARPGAGADSGAVRIIPQGSRGNRPASEAGTLASQCRWCENAPCARACPRAADIPGIMRRMEAGNVAGAARVALEAGLADACAVCADGASNADGNGIPGRVPCEKVCVRMREKGAPVAILRVLEALR